MKNVIAISGWKGSGKDTVAHHLVQNHGYTQISFAAKLKDLVALQYGVPRAWLDDPTKKEMPLVNYPVISSDPFTEAVHHLLRKELQSGYWTPRALCILEGSIKRSVNSNYWTKSVIQEILDNPGSGKYVISDMRYISEADTLKLFIPEISLWRIHRFDTVDTEDPSERNLDTYSFSHVIPNQAGLGALYEHVERVLERK